MNHSDSTKHWKRGPVNKWTKRPIVCAPINEWLVYLNQFVYSFVNHSVRQAFFSVGKNWFKSYWTIKISLSTEGVHDFKFCNRNFKRWRIHYRLFYGNWNDPCNKSVIDRRSVPISHRSVKPIYQTTDIITWQQGSQYISRFPEFSLSILHIKCIYIMQ